MTWGQKESEIMINDLVNKGHTKLNMFSVLCEQTKSLCSKQSKLNGWNWQHPQIAFLCCYLTQAATWWKKPYNFDIKCPCNLESYEQQIFLAPSLGGGKIFFIGGFFKKALGLTGLTSFYFWGKRIKKYYNNLYPVDFKLYPLSFLLYPPSYILYPLPYVL